MSKTRIHSHDQHLVHVRQNLLQYSRGRCRINDHPGSLAQGTNALHRAVLIVVAFPVDEKGVGTSLGELVKEEVRVGYHEMRLQGQRCDPSQ